MFYVSRVMLKITLILTIFFAFEQVFAASEPITKAQKSTAAQVAAGRAAAQRAKKNTKKAEHNNDGIATKNDEQGIVILIHGTWAIQSDWCMPGGDFFDALEKAAQERNSHVVPFMWSGANSHEHRMQAAHILAKLIKSYPPTINVTIVAHSHGGNVVNLASQLIAQNNPHGHKIAKVHSLGTPVCVATYPPNMDVIQHLYHYFSFEDYVQPVLGMYERAFPPHQRIANIRVVLSGAQPGHSSLHDPLIAPWLLDMHENLITKKIGNFYNFRFDQPGLVVVSSFHPPFYKVDTEQEELLKRDKKEAETSA